MNNTTPHPPTWKERLDRCTRILTIVIASMFLLLAAFQTNPIAHSILTSDWFHYCILGYFALLAVNFSCKYSFAIRIFSVSVCVITYTVILFLDHYGIVDAKISDLLNASTAVQIFIIIALMIAFVFYIQSLFNRAVHYLWTGFCKTVRAVFRAVTKRDNREND